MSKEIQIRLPKLHPSQQNVINTSKRFNVLKNGRRWGKTTLAVELATQTLLDGFPVAYFAPTYKDMHEVWQTLIRTLSDIISYKNETVKQIKLITGGTLDLWSMEDPDSGRGRKYKRVIIDECEKAPKFKTAWQFTIRPTLTDLEGDAWILSTPKAVNTYFHELFEFPKTRDNWASWCLPSSDNPYLPKEEILSAEKDLDPITFRQEFLAQSTSTTDKPFFYCFEEKHVSEDMMYDSGYPLYLSFDFNVMPMCCLIGQSGFRHEKPFIHFLDEVHLQNSDIYEVCRRIKSKYLGAHFIVTGDRSGMARTGLQKNLNYFVVIKKELELKDAQFKLPSSNPHFNESLVLCNSILANHPDLKFHRTNCKETIYDLRFVEWDGQKIVKDDRNKRPQQADLADCLRYYFNAFHKDFVRRL